MKAAVLDFDGVVAQSMEQHAEAYRLALAPLGVDVSQQAVFEREGARSETIIADLLAAAGRPIPDEQEIGRLADTKQRHFRELGEVRLYPGAQQMVEALAASPLKLALVTGTRRSNLERLIPDLLPLFDAVAAQEDYTHDKPHPEPYANAASALGLARADCMALENAVRGVESARAAGYGQVFGIATTMPAERLLDAGAARVVADQAEATALLLDQAA
ncbi:MAG: HAD family hydrolase [Thermoplasmatota archaeon]